jgi:DNA-binding MarR family transcriptional regulator
MAATKRNRARPGADQSALEDLIGFHIRLSMLALRRSFFQHVGDGGVRPGLSSLVQLLAANEGVSQTELSESLGIDKGTIVSLIDTAESSGWITRARAEHDRRRHELVLTDKGKAVAKELGEQTREHEKKFRARFTDEELANLIDYLKRIYS